MPRLEAKTAAVLMKELLLITTYVLKKEGGSATRRHGLPSFIGCLNPGFSADLQCMP